MAHPDNFNEGKVGDVETAGETTAADAVSGPSHTKPVGAGTSVGVADSSDSSRHGGTTTEDLVNRQGEDSSDEPES